MKSALNRKMLLVIFVLELFFTSFRQIKKCQIFFSIFSKTRESQTSKAIAHLEASGDLRLSQGITKGIKVDNQHTENSKILHFGPNKPTFLHPVSKNSLNPAKLQIRPTVC